MRTINTADATGAALDWLVAMALGLIDATVTFPSGMTSNRIIVGEIGRAYDMLTGRHCAYSTDWSQGGSIIEREKINLEWWHTDQLWHSCMNERLQYDGQGEFIEGSDFHLSGSTPLIAGLRCFVASRLGDTVEVPDELT